MSHRTGNVDRRGFLASLGALGAAHLASTAGAFSFAEPGTVQLGFDNFSVRAFNWKAPQLIQYAASLKVDTLLLSDLDVYESFDEAYLQKVRRQADEAGVGLQAGTSSICPTSQSYDAKKWGKAEDHARLLIRTAKQLGSSVARCYLGNGRDREGDGGIEKHIEQMAKVLRAVQGEAEEAGVKIAVENHAGDMQAWELVGLIQAAGAGFVGATMDPGNALWALEDPMVNLELLGPYALTTGIRDTAVWETPRGATTMWANMGQGVVDWQAYVKRYRELCPRTPFVLEIISYRWASEAAYLEPEFWSKYPRARAHEFARFVALAKRGSKYVIPPGRPDGTASAELEQSQQRWDLEESLRYCRDVLGLGANS